MNEWKLEFKVNELTFLFSIYKNNNNFNISITTIPEAKEIFLLPIEWSIHKSFLGQKFKTPDLFYNISSELKVDFEKKTKLTIPDNTMDEINNKILRLLSNPKDWGHSEPIPNN